MKEATLVSLKDYVQYTSSREEREFIEQMQEKHSGEIAFSSLLHSYQAIIDHPSKDKELKSLYAKELIQAMMKLDGIQGSVSKDSYAIINGVFLERNEYRLLLEIYKEQQKHHRDISFEEIFSNSALGIIEEQFHFLLEDIVKKESLLTRYQKEVNSFGEKKERTFFSLSEMAKLFFEIGEIYAQ